MERTNQKVRFELYQKQTFFNLSENASLYVLIPLQQFIISNSSYLCLISVTHIWKTMMILVIQEHLNLCLICDWDVNTSMLPALLFT